MFGLFKKKTEKTTSPLEMPAVQKVEKVLISKSGIEATEDWRIVSAVVDFVNTMRFDGVYYADEIPAEAYQAYHSDYYLAQVFNGGHAQFVLNSKSNASITWPNIVEGLKSMGATEHSAVFADFLAWITETFGEDASQIQLEDVHTAKLNDFDNRFDDAERISKLSTLNAAWIKTWRSLQIVPDASYKNSLQRTVDLNPMRNLRLRRREIVSLEANMKERLRAGLGLAATNSTNLEFVVHVGAGYQETIEGEKKLAFYVRTNVGERFGVATDEYTALYEYIAGTPVEPVDPNDPDGHLKSYEAFKSAGAVAPTPGKRLSKVEASEIEQFIAASRSLEAAAAIHCLLAFADMDTSKAMIAPASFNPPGEAAEVRYFVVVDNTLYITLSAEERSLLIRFEDREFVSQATMTDIKRYKDILMKA